MHVKVLEMPWPCERSTQGPLCCDSGLCTRDTLPGVESKLNRTGSVDTKEGEASDTHVSKKQRQESKKIRPPYFNTIFSSS